MLLYSAVVALNETILLNNKHKLPSCTSMFLRFVMMNFYEILLLVVETNFTKFIDRQRFSFHKLLVHLNNIQIPDNLDLRKINMFSVVGLFVLLNVSWCCLCDQQPKQSNPIPGNLDWYLTDIRQQITQLTVLSIIKQFVVYKINQLKN